MSMDQFLKTPGSALFYGNRTKQPYLPENHNYTPRCTIPIVSHVYRYKKNDISIQQGWNINPAGGYLIYNGVTPIAYESIEVGTGETGSGVVGFARITITGGLFQNLDKITLGSKTIELRTDGQGGDYYNNSKWNISSTSLATQLAEITSKFVNVVSYPQYLPDSGKIFCVSDNLSYIYFYGRRLDTTSDGLAIGVVSSNPNVSITQGVASPVKSTIAIQDVRYRAFNAGSSGNNISITYTSGATTSAPEVTINGGNQIDIKIQSGTTSAQQIVNAVNAASALQSVITAELNVAGTGASSQSSPVPATFLDGGTSHTMTPWTPGDKLKNCYIPAPKQMYGYNDFQANSITLGEAFIPANTVVLQSYHALQVIGHPNYNYGAWFRKNTPRNATVRFSNSGSYNGAYSYLELQLKGVAAGLAGNQYSFEVRNHPQLGQGNVIATNPRFRLENNANGTNKKIVFILGLENSAPSYTRATTDMNMFNDAIVNGDAAIKDLIDINYLQHSSFNISTPQSETFFSGGTAVAESDFFSEGAFDLVWGCCRFNTFGGYYALGDLGVDGKSRQADDTGNVLKTSGKMGGIFARVVPAGTAFKSYKFISDLKYTSVGSGTAANNITIKYNSGAVKGSEVVSVVGNAISVQIADTLSTALDIKTKLDASVAASSLVKVKLVGTPANPQSISITPSPINLTGGAAALTKDSGYFITSRRNMQSVDTDLINQNGYRQYEVLFSKDLSNPDSFQHVLWFNINHQGEHGLRGDRIAMEFLDYYQNGGVGLQVQEYHSSGQFVNLSGDRSALEATAHLVSGDLICKSTAYGSDGNRANRIKIESGATAGAELATISGNDITLKISSGVSTVAQVQAAIAAAPAVAAKITASPYSTDITTSVVSVTHDFVELNSGVDYWPHEGYWGFGYCSINEFSFIENNATCAYNSAKRKTPRGWPNEMMVEAFRVTKLV